jgi:hypothetical protein
MQALAKEKLKVHQCMVNRGRILHYQHSREVLLKGLQNRMLVRSRSLRSTVGWKEWSPLVSIT